MDVSRGDRVLLLGAEHEVLGRRGADMKQHQRDCPFAQRVVLDTVPGWSPSCICGPCDHPAEWVRPGVLTGEPFCDFCKTMVAEKVEAIKPPVASSGDAPDGWGQARSVLGAPPPLTEGEAADFGDRSWANYDDARLLAQLQRVKRQEQSDD